MGTHRLYRTLIQFDIPEKACSILAMAIDKFGSGEKFDSEKIANALFDELSAYGANAEPIAEVLAKLVGHCFWSERFSHVFVSERLETKLVECGLSSPAARGILLALSEHILSDKRGEPRQEIKFPLDAGDVAMCDFSFLRKPEMQKPRRVIVVSLRKYNSGRLVVVPVSKTPPRNPAACVHRFEAKSYSFFHRLVPVWAVCDHPTTVALSRLWFVNVNGQPQRGARVSAHDLQQVRLTLKHGLDISP